MSNQQGGAFVAGTLIFSLIVIAAGAAMCYFGKGTVAFVGGVIAFFGLMILHGWYKMAVGKAITSTAERFTNQRRP